MTNYYTLGRTGLRVSRLALGTMTFGTPYGWGCDRETSLAMFDAYVEAGGNLFDTANLYTDGISEQWLGEFVAERGLRDKAVIATKFTFNREAGDPNIAGNSRKNILRSIEGSLRSLRTDYIDLYILHAWDRVTPADEVIRTLDDLVRSGKVRHIGLSNVPAWYAARAQTVAEFRGYEPVSTLQLEYSLTERNIEHELIPFGLHYGAGVMVWSPLASGLLSGKYRAAETADGRLAVITKGGPRVSERKQAIIATLDAVAGELGRSMAQVAVNWVANRPGVATTILGASKLEQLTDSLAALDFTIPAELRDRLDEVSRPPVPYPTSFFNSDTLTRLTGNVPIADKPPGYSGK